MKEKPDFSDFFEMCQSDEFQAFAEDFRSRNHPANLWNARNREKLRECQKDYEKSESGKQVRKEIIYRRHESIREDRELLSWSEKKQIRKFYVDCPKGYVVDHIVPIAIGGRHCLSNLQYLTPEENQKKHCKKYWKYKNKYD